MKSILITSSILILVLAALRPVLRGRIDPRVQYALWLLAALRLLVPVEWASSAYSALALLDRAEEPRQIVERIGRTALPMLGAMSYEDAYDQAMQEWGQTGPSTAGLSEEEMMNVYRRVQDLQESVPTLGQLAEKYAKPIWLGGAALMAAWFLLVNLALRRKLRTALPVETDCPLPVRVTPDLPSPCLCGVFRPAIYVTPDALAAPDRMRHVLAHELTHYRHRDHWWALVRCLCLCVYWFNPLVWWAAALSRQDCELACDAGAIRRLGEEERLAYGRTLVAMIASGRNSLLQTATTMTGGRHRVKERVTLIARKPKTVLAAALALAVVLTLAVGWTFTGAPEESPEPAASGDPAPLSSDGLNTATLRSRLQDVPDELYTEVDALSGGTDTTVLAEYWMHRPWTDYQEGWGWLMTVYQWDQAQFEENYSVLTGTWECFARDENFYYVTARATDVRVPASEEMVAEMPGATEVETKYLEDFEAIRAFAKKTVLETEGVEPYDGNPPQPLETLQARLLDVPEELQDNVEAHADDGALAVYYFRKPGEELDKAQYLLIVNQFTQERFDEIFREAPSHGGCLPFARGGGYGYALYWNTSIEYDLEDQELFTAAYRAVSGYAQKTVLETEGVEPFQLEATPAQAVKSVADQLVAAPVMELELSLDSIGYPSCSTDPSTGNGPYFLNNLAASFQWEEFDWGTTEDPQFPLPDLSSMLSLHTPYGSETAYIRVYQDSDLVAVHGTRIGTNWYRATDPDGRLTPFQYLRSLYDEAELMQLRITSVPDRGQGHQDVVKEWLGGYEGAYIKCAPGSQFHCTYVEGRDIQSDWPNWFDAEQLEEFAQSHGLEASEFTKTWFGFRYSLLFLPADEYARNYMMAGNTHEYDGAGWDAPEGAMAYTRMAIMRLIDGNWTCESTGTGW